MSEKNKLRFGNVKAGDLILRQSYAEVVSKSGSADSPLLTLKDKDLGYEYQLSGRPLVEACYSADYASNNAIECTMTELAEKLIDCKGVPFTVVFVKQNGEERTLRGRYLAHERLLGRSKVEDLDIDGMRVRLVDHRTLRSITVNGQRFVLKKK